MPAYTLEDLLSQKDRTKREDEIMLMIAELLRPVGAAESLLTPIEKTVVLHIHGLFGYSPLSFEEIATQWGRGRNHPTAETMEEFYKKAMAKIKRELWRRGLDLEEEDVRDFPES